MVEYKLKIDPKTDSYTGLPYRYETPRVREFVENRTTDVKDPMVMWPLPWVNWLPK